MNRNLEESDVKNSADFQETAIYDPFHFQQVRRKQMKPLSLQNFLSPSTSMILKKKTPKTKNPCPLIKTVYYVKLSYHIQQSFKKLKSLSLKFHLPGDLKYPVRNLQPALTHSQQNLGLSYRTYPKGEDDINTKSTENYSMYRLPTGFQFAVGKYSFTTDTTTCLP